MIQTISRAGARLSTATLGGFVALALAFASFAPAAPALAGGGTVLDGQAAPELALSDGLNGASAQTTFASLRGKVVCLKFWLTGCPVCRATLPEPERIDTDAAKRPSSSSRVSGETRYLPTVVLVWEWVMVRGRSHARRQSKCKGNGPRGGPGGSILGCHPPAGNPEHT